MSTIVARIEQLLPALDPALQHAAVMHPARDYITAGFRDYVDLALRSLGGARRVRAFYQPVLDCLATESLRYVRPTAARFFCCYFTAHPDAMDASQAWQTTLHEAGHHLQFADDPTRDMREGEALRLFFTRDTTTRPAGGHCRDWIRATAHLMHRAEAGGVRLDWGAMFGGYFTGDARQLRDALQPELDSIGRPIESHLRAPAPAAFTRLCDAAGVAPSVLVERSTAAATTTPQRTPERRTAASRSSSTRSPYSVVPRISIDAYGRQRFDLVPV